MTTSRFGTTEHEGDFEGPLHFFPKEGFNGPGLCTEWDQDDVDGLRDILNEEDEEALYVHRPTGQEHKWSKDCPCCPKLITLFELRMPDAVEKLRSMERLN